MTTWFALRTCTIWQTHTALRVVWATALLVFTATNAMANGGGTVKPIVVDANTTPCLTSYSAHYTTIPAAVNTAPSGATISICAGNYPEQITIGMPLTLKGVTNLSANAGAAVITMPPAANWVSKWMSVWSWLSVGRTGTCASRQRQHYRCWRGRNQFRSGL
jgi:hypothetical protein